MCIYVCALDPFLYGKGFHFSILGPMEIVRDASLGQTWINSFFQNPDIVLPGNRARVCFNKS